MKRMPALIVAASLVAVSTGARAQDPAYVNGGGYDPLRASSPMPRPSPRSGDRTTDAYGNPLAPLGSTDSLDRVESLREQLSRQSQENGSMLPEDQRGALAQLLEQSGTLVQQAKGGSNNGSAAGPNPLDFNAVQSDPRVQAGARQAKAAMDTLERSLLPMLQDFKNRFDAELARASANRR